jgi:ATP-dependent phosphoenolpyruvate carboxykinase
MNSWDSKENYKIEAEKLISLFKENFISYGEDVKYLIKSGPK